MMQPKPSTLTLLPYISSQPPSLLDSFLVRFVSTFGHCYSGPFSCLGILISLPRPPFPLPPPLVTGLVGGPEQLLESTSHTGQTSPMAVFLLQADLNGDGVLEFLEYLYLVVAVARRAGKKVTKPPP